MQNSTLKAVVCTDGERGPDPCSAHLRISLCTSKLRELAAATTIVGDPVPACHEATIAERRLLLYDTSVVLLRAVCSFLIHLLLPIRATWLADAW